MALKTFKIHDLDQKSVAVHKEFSAWIANLDARIQYDVNASFASDQQVFSEIMELVIDQRLIEQLEEKRREFYGAAA